MDDPVEDERRAAILDAALGRFAAYGFARTAMADIAEAAGMSRPALYQYFANKEEIFRAMLGRILADAADKAINALETEADLEAQLDGFLQRWMGDLAEQMRATEHGDDIVEAKAGYAQPVYEEVSGRVRRALRRHLTAAGVDDVDAATDLLLLAPLGLKYYEPSTARFRRRLRSLAASVASGG